MRADSHPVGSDETPNPLDTFSGSRPTPSLSVGAACLLTAEDLAGRWRVPKSHVYRLTREGAIPAVKLGRYYRYRQEAIEAFERGAATRAQPPRGGVA